MLTIAFLQDNHNHPGYTGASMREGGVGGTESSVIQLAEALAARGHRVFALNRIDERLVHAGVRWLPLSEKKTLSPVDVAIGINSARLFDGVTAGRNIVWFHNPPTLKQQLKRRNFIALLRYRPHAVLLGAYHSGLLNRRLPYSGRSIIPHGVGESFFLRLPDAGPRPPRAIFTSQPRRGLDFVVEAWKEIFPRVPGAELHIFCPQAKERETAEIYGQRKGVVIRGSVNPLKLAAELQTARVLLIPGVADETFCIAAAEATASGVPIVTLGVGALLERVSPGKTGYISANRDDFCQKAIELLNQDASWMTMHANCLSDSALATWATRAREWEGLFSRLAS